MNINKYRRILSNTEDKIYNIGYKVIQFIFLCIALHILGCFNALNSWYEKIQIRDFLKKDKEAMIKEIESGNAPERAQDLLCMKYSHDPEVLGNCALRKASDPYNYEGAFSLLQEAASSRLNLPPYSRSKFWYYLGLMSLIKNQSGYNFGEIEKIFLINDIVYNPQEFQRGEIILPHYFRTYHDFSESFLYDPEQYMPLIFMGILNFRSMRMQFYQGKRKLWYLNSANNQLISRDIYFNDDEALSVEKNNFISPDSVYGKSSYPVNLKGDSVAFKKMIKNHWFIQGNAAISCFDQALAKIRKNNPDDWSLNYICSFYKSIIYFQLELYDELCRQNNFTRGLYKQKQMKLYARPDFKSVSYLFLRESDTARLRDYFIHIDKYWREHNGCN